ncbi:MAG: DUF3990 domain-containing protein [Prevotella sp.]|nr:DUF3990 domain-containing protein [Prevotella sp.]
MRILYHGGTCIIKTPFCAVGRDHLDFGKGFYLTDIKEQAVSWATRIANVGLPQWLNVYQLDEQMLGSYRQKVFAAYDAEWLRFIAKSRVGQKPWEGYDLIEGGVADDRVVDTIEYFLNGDITEEMALRRLALHQPNNQICILSQAIVDNCLQYIKSEPLNDLAE